VAGFSNPMEAPHGLARKDNARAIQLPSKFRPLIPLAVSRFDIKKIIDTPHPDKLWFSTIDIVAGRGYLKNFFQMGSIQSRRLGDHPKINNFRMEPISVSH
jgi:hypothetical protein